MAPNNKKYIGSASRTALLIAVTAVAGLIATTSCGSSEETKTEDTEVIPADDKSYRYDHIDNIINQYCRLLMDTPPDGQQMEELLMDINSRCHLLMTEGDTLTALYFHHAIENNIRLRDSVLADRIFGICPYTAFNLEAE